MGCQLCAKAVWIMDINERYTVYCPFWNHLAPGFVLLRDVLLWLGSSNTS